MVLVGGGLGPGRAPHSEISNSLTPNGPSEARAIWGQTILDFQCPPLITPLRYGCCPHPKHNVRPHNKNEHIGRFMDMSCVKNPVLGIRIQIRIRIRKDPNVLKDPNPNPIKSFGFGSGSERIRRQILFSKTFFKRKNSFER